MFPRILPGTVESNSSVVKKSLVTLAMVNMMGCSNWENPYNCDNLDPELINLPESQAYMFMLWRPADVSMEAFTDTLNAEVIPTITDLSPNALKLYLDDPEFSDSVPSLVINRTQFDGSVFSGIVSYQADDPLQANAIAEAIKVEIEEESNISLMAGYDITRTNPVTYEQVWDDGEVSPGVSLVSIFQKRPSLSYEEYYAEWFCAHSPIAKEVHPYFNYERNVINDSFTSSGFDAPYFDAIVSEHVGIDSDLSDQDAFFGGDAGTWLWRITLSAFEFINFLTIETYTMRETIIIGED